MKLYRYIFPILMFLVVYAVATNNSLLQNTISIGVGVFVIFFKKEISTDLIYGKKFSYFFPPTKLPENVVENLILLVGAGFISLGLFSLVFLN